MVLSSCMCVHVCVCVGQHCHSNLGTKVNVQYVQAKVITHLSSEISLSYSCCISCSSTSVSSIWLEGERRGSEQRYRRRKETRETERKRTNKTHRKAHNTRTHTHTWCAR